jgi:hypothetical protein
MRALFRKLKIQNATKKPAYDIIFSLNVNSFNELRINKDEHEITIEYNAVIPLIPSIKL